MKTTDFRRFSLFLLLFTTTSFFIGCFGSDEDSSGGDDRLRIEVENSSVEEGNSASINLDYDFPDPLTSSVTVPVRILEAGSKELIDLDVTSVADLGTDYSIQINGEEVTSSNFNLTITPENGRFASIHAEVLLDGKSEGEEEVHFAIGTITANTERGDVTIEGKTTGFTITDSDEVGVRIREDAIDTVALVQGGSVSINLENYVFEGRNLTYEASIFAGDPLGEAIVSGDGNELRISANNGTAGERMKLQLTARSPSGIEVSYTDMVALIVAPITTQSISDVAMTLGDTLTLAFDSNFVADDRLRFVYGATHSDSSVASVTVDNENVASVQIIADAVGNTRVEVYQLEVFRGTGRQDIAFTVTVDTLENLTPAFTSSNRGSTTLLGGNSGRYGTPFQFLTNGGEALDITFETPTDVSGQLASGTYKYGYDNQTDPANTVSFDFADYEEVDVTGGNIEVVRNGNNNYNFTFNLTLDDGRTLVATYNGNVTEP